MHSWPVYMFRKWYFDYSCLSVSVAKWLTWRLLWLASWFIFVYFNKSASLSNGQQAIDDKSWSEWRVNHPSSLTCACTRISPTAWTRDSLMSYAYPASSDAGEVVAEICACVRTCPAIGDERHVHFTRNFL